MRLKMPELSEISRMQIAPASHFDSFHFQFLQSIMNCALPHLLIRLYENSCILNNIGVTVKRGLTLLYKCNIIREIILVLLSGRKRYVANTP